MASLTTHLVVGERVYLQAPQLEGTQADTNHPTTYGTFLLGCVVPDVSMLGTIDRRETHFVGRPDEDGADAFTQSCTRFLARLDGLLHHPWGELPGEERSFVAGYLCHLAADEAWKASAWRALGRLGMRSSTELGVPLGVITTAGSVLSAELYRDFPALSAALREAFVPDVFRHVPYGAFVEMWDLVQPHLLDGRTYASYLELLTRRGMPEFKIQEMGREHEQYWEQAVALVRDMGGVEPMVLACVERAIEMLARLWEQSK
jgi:hypothetical protein